MRYSLHRTHFLHFEAMHTAHPAGMKAQGHYRHIVIQVPQEQYTNLLCKNIPSCSLSWLKSFPGL